MRVFAIIRWTTRLAPLAALAALLLTPVGSQAATASTTQQLVANFSAASAFISTSYNVTLANTGTIFNSLTGNVLLSYRVRTGSHATSTMGITLKATSDFSPAGAISITNSSALKYKCSAASLGTSCGSTGQQTVSMTTAAPVVTFPPSACTGTGCAGTDPNSVTLTFNAADDPSYKTGSYTAILTLTISSI